MSGVVNRTCEHHSGLVAKLDSIHSLLLDEREQRRAFEDEIRDALKQIPMNLDAIEVIAERAEKKADANTLKSSWIVAAGVVLLAWWGWLTVYVVNHVAGRQ